MKGNALPATTSDFMLNGSLQGLLQVTTTIDLKPIRIYFAAGVRVDGCC